MSNAIVKSVQGALARVTGQGQKAGHQTPIASSFSGLNRAYNDAPDMAGLMTTYYRFDPADFINMSPEEIGDFVDNYAEAARFLKENLPVLKQHYIDYIEGVVAYHEFIRDCVKAGVSGMKKIDKTTLDVLLGKEDWQANTQKLAKDADVTRQKRQRDLDDYFDEVEHELQIYFQIAANKLQRKQAELDARPEQEEQQLAERTASSERKRYIKSLINHGRRKTLPFASAPVYTTTATNSNTSNGNSRKSQGNFFQNAVNFFKGK